MKLKPTEKVYLADSEIENADRGMFATQKIAKDELIERSPIIYLILLLVMGHFITTHTNPTQLTKSDWRKASLIFMQ